MRERERERERESEREREREIERRVGIVSSSLSDQKHTLYSPPFISPPLVTHSPPPPLILTLARSMSSGLLRTIFPLSETHSLSFPPSYFLFPYLPVVSPSPFPLPFPLPPSSTSLIPQFLFTKNILRSLDKIYFRISSL